MSELYFKRLRPMEPTKRNAEGRLLCRQCNDPLEGRQTAYCSEACRRLYYIPRLWSVAVAAVNRRDNGVCTSCGRDGTALRRQFADLHYRWQDARGEAAARLNQERMWLIKTLNAEGFHLHSYVSIPEEGDLWQIDHILPIHEGGGGCGLENLQTLCTPCHKRKSASEAMRRAELRRTARRKARK